MQRDYHCDGAQTPLRSAILWSENLQGSMDDKTNSSINTHWLQWMQTCVDADVTKHFRKGVGGGGCVVMRFCPDTLVWQWKEQYSWLGTKTAASLSSANQKKKKKKKNANECIIFSPLTIPFPSTPRQRCLQIAIIPPLFHICAWTCFKRPGLFISPLAVRKFAP